MYLKEHEVMQRISSADAGLMDQMYSPILTPASYTVSEEFRHTVIYPTIASLYTSTVWNEWLRVVNTYYTRDCLLSAKLRNESSVGKANNEINTSGGGITTANNAYIDNGNNKYEHILAQIQLFQREMAQVGSVVSSNSNSK